MQIDTGAAMMCAGFDHVQEIANIVFDYIRIVAAEGVTAERLAHQSHGERSHLYIKHAALQMARALRNAERCLSSLAETPAGACRALPCTCRVLTCDDSSAYCGAQLRVSVLCTGFKNTRTWHSSDSTSQVIFYRNPHPVWRRTMRLMFGPLVSSDGAWVLPSSASCSADLPKRAWLR